MRSTSSVCLCGLSAETRIIRVLVVLALILGLMTQPLSAAEHIWANSNVEGASPPAMLDWFSDGLNDQGTWLGGDPVSAPWVTQINVFEDTITPLAFTSPGSYTHTLNLNYDGVDPFELHYLLLNGKASDSPGANLKVVLGGEQFWFSNVSSPQGGTINVGAMSHLQSLDYEITSPITVGQDTASNFAGTLMLQGYGTGGLTISGGIGELKTGGAVIHKHGQNTVRIAGSNSASGDVTIFGGTLIFSGTNSGGGNRITAARGTMVFDLEAGDNRWSDGISDPALRLRGGTVIIRGAPEGTSAQTFQSLNTLAGESTVIVNPNGGEGTTLVIGSEWTNGDALGGHVLFDLSASGAFLQSDAPVGGGLIREGTWGGFCHVLVKDADGIGFGTVEDGYVVRYTDATHPEPRDYANQNYIVSGYHMTEPAWGGHVAKTFRSLHLDASQEDGEFDLNELSLTAAVLMTGDHDFTISNGSLYPYGGSLHQFGKGTLTIDATITVSILKSGPGRVIFGTAPSFSSDSRGITIANGVIEAIDGDTFSTDHILRLPGGVFQSHGTLADRTLGASSPYQSKVAWQAFADGYCGRGGGFAARGGTFTINFSDGEELVWNETGGFVRDSQMLIFGSESADSLLDWQNPIDLGSSLYATYPAGSFVMRQIHVDDNPDSEADIAQMSGVLSGTRGGLIKSGTGTLRLTADNTYSGMTFVKKGALVYDGSLDASDYPVIVYPEGALAGSGSVSRPVEVFGTLAMLGNDNFELNGDCRLFEDSALHWSEGATGTVEIDGKLTLPTNGQAVFGGALKERLVLCSSTELIEGSPDEWEVTPPNVSVYLSQDGKQLLACAPNATLILVE